MSVPHSRRAPAPASADIVALEDDVAAALAVVAACISDAAFFCDGRGVIQACNATAVALFGYRESEVVGREITELIPGGLDGLPLHDDTWLRSSARAAGNANRAVMTEAARKDATTFPVGLALSRLFAGDGRYPALYLAIVKHMASQEDAKRESMDAGTEFERRVAEFNDFKARVEVGASEAIGMAEQVERAREAAENDRIRVKAVLEAVGDVIVATDSNGIIDTVNPAVTLTFGYRADEVIGKPLSILIPELSSDANCDPAGTGDGMEYEARRKSGKLFPVELAVSGFQIGNDRCVIAAIRDITERKAAEEMVRKLALTDPLTGLSNRNLFNRRLNDALNTAKRLGTHVALMLLDLDDFKSVNDNFGHPVGDALLIEVARRLERCVREVDTVARLGGDEFAIIVSNIESLGDADTVATRVIERLSEQLTIEGCLVSAGVSIGISIYPRDDTDPEALVRLADRALFEAKANGQGAYRFYDRAIEHASRARKLLEHDLRLALVREEFVLHYQPQVDMPGRQLIGAEALVRWQSPAGRMIPPGEFIPAAESSGLIVEIGEWVLRESCRQNKAWQNAGLPPVRVSVNVSARQFQSHSLVATVEAALGESGLAPDWLELEITEGTILIDSNQVRDNFDRLRDLGVALAIDDFGTGYCSLAYLKRFPVRRLKIDRTFVKNVVTDPNDAAIAEAVIRLGHSLNLSVMAEGVETEDQAEFFVALGCDEAQGFLFSRPLPAAEFARWHRSPPRPRLGG